MEKEDLESFIKLNNQIEVFGVTPEVIAKYMHDKLVNM